MYHHGYAALCLSSNLTCCTDRDACAGEATSVQILGSFHGSSRRDNAQQCNSQKARALEQPCVELFGRRMSRSNGLPKSHWLS